MNCDTKERRKFICIHSWHATQFGIIKSYFQSVTLSNYPILHIERYRYNFNGHHFSQLFFKFESFKFLNEYINRYDFWFHIILHYIKLFFVIIIALNVTFYERSLIRCSWYNYVLSGSNKDSLQRRCKPGNRSCDQVRFAFRYFDY